MSIGRLVHQKRIVSTEAYGDYPSETVNALLQREEDGKTIFTCSILYPSKDVRDAGIASGMEHGVAECYDRLAEVLHVKAGVSLE